MRISGKRPVGRIAERDLLSASSKALGLKRDLYSTAKTADSLSQIASISKSHRRLPGYFGWTFKSSKRSGGRLSWPFRSQSCASYSVAGFLLSIVFLFRKTADFRNNMLVFLFCIVFLF